MTVNVDSIVRTGEAGNASLQYGGATDVAGECVDEGSQRGPIWRRGVTRRPLSARVRPGMPPLGINNRGRAVTATGADLPLWLTEVAVFPLLHVETHCRARRTKTPGSRRCIAGRPPVGTHHRGGHREPPPGSWVAHGKGYDQRNGIAGTRRSMHRLSLDGQWCGSGSCRSRWQLSSDSPACRGR